MVLRRIQWIVAVKLIYLVIFLEAQNDRSYDTNDWIPITPTSKESTEAEPSRATGRVLNLDSPSQKFFPEHDYDYRKRRPNRAQFLRENTFNKASSNGRQKSRHQNEYKFEVPPPPPQNAPQLQYFTNQEVKLPTHEQPPALNQAQFVELPQYVQNNQQLLLERPQLSNLNQKQTLGQSLDPARITAPNPKEEKETVQLLYVPLENLKPNQPITQDSQTVFQQIEAPGQQKQIFTQNTPQRISDIEHDLIQQTVQAHALEHQIHLGEPILLQTTTTPAPVKRKPHQPPLSIYMEGNADADSSDVLEALKGATTIAVQDKFSPDSPKIFVGPTALSSPPGYTKFPIPYLNKLEGNRVERKIDDLPYFVAPVSYKAPPGYSKILLPSPHVGSIVVSNKEESHKRSASKPESLRQNQINEYQPPQQTYTIPVSDKTVFAENKEKLNSHSFDYDSSNPSYFSPQTHFNANPLRTVQQPQYLQFTINDNLNHFAVPTKSPSELNNGQPLRTDNISATNPSSNANSEKLQSNQFLTNENANKFKVPEAASQNIPQGNSNLFSTPLKSIDQHDKYKVQTSTEDKGTKDYKIPAVPARSTQYQFGGDFLGGNIHSYDIPATNLDPFSSQYNPSSFISEDTDPYNIPIRTSHRQRYLSNENKNSFDAPSRDGRPTEDNFQYNQPSSAPTLSSAEHAQTSVVNITPKTTTPSPVKEIEETIKEYHSTAYQTTDRKEKQKVNINPLELAINQYELHQINSQLTQEKPKEIKDPYDVRYDLDEIKEPKKEEKHDYSSQFESDKAKVKGHYDYGSEFELDRPKFDFSSQFDRYTSTPATILRDIYSEDKAAVRPPTKGRRRGKPTRQPIKATTDNPAQRETYTVLEEFSVKTSTTPKYFETPKNNKYLPEHTVPIHDEVADVPANVYRLKTTTPKYENIKVESPTTQHIPVHSTEIVDTPADVYNLNTNQKSSVYANADPTNQEVNTKDLLPDSFTTERNTPLVQNFEQQSYINQNLYTQQHDGGSDIQPLIQKESQKQQENEYNYNQNNAGVPDYVHNLQEQSVRTLLVPNLLVPPTKDHESTIGYQPLTEQTIPTSTTTTTTTTTTEKPIETTTAHTRNRSRQRGGSRFSTPSTHSTHSASSSSARRTANRRRPVHPSRTTTESPTVTAEYTPKEDFKRVTTRQRLRTRGRPVQNSFTERISTTANEIRPYNEPTSEAIFEVQTTHKEPQSYAQFDQTVEDQKIIINQDDDSNKDYQVYGLQPPDVITDNPRAILQYDNTATTQRPIANIQVTHPVVANERQPNIIRTTESQIHVQSGGVLYNNKNEGSSRVNGRVRGRTRGRTRAPTTTERSTTRRIIATPATTIITTTTPKKPSPKEDLEEEFYGFIRQPNFNQIHNIQIASATQQPIQIYQNSPNKIENANVYPNSDNPTTKQNIRPLYQNIQNPTGVGGVRVNFNSEPFDATTVNFVGQIRPKFRTTQNYEQIVTTTEQNLEQETETPKPRKRARIRLSPRKTPANHRQSYNEVSTLRADQTTRRSNVVRGRGRGTAQYRLPENLKPKKDKEADVEGGNYPTSFLQNKQPVATALPSFQITVGPGLEGEEDEGDQLPNYSISRPNILPRPDGWTEVTGSTVNNEAYVPANQIVEYEKNLQKEKGISQTDNESQIIEQPTALHLVSSTEQSPQSSDESYRENTKAAEELFSDINENSKTEPVTTEKSLKQKGRRRGTWKLVKQRPVDNFEAAESQNYYAVVNLFDNISKDNNKVNRFDDEEQKSTENYQAYNNFNPILEQNSDSYDYEIQKIKISSTEPLESYTEYYETNGTPSETEDNVQSEESNIIPTEQSENHTTSNNETEAEASSTTSPTITSKESSIFNVLYEMLGTGSKIEDAKEPRTTTQSVIEQETTRSTITTILPTFPQEITEVPTTTSFKEDSSNSTIAENINTDSPQTSTSSEEEEENRIFEVEPWEMKAVKTSTSTEISLQTEICYKGRCIKSADQKIRS